MKADHFEEARHLHRRAIKHLRELGEATAAHDPQELWSVEITPISDSRCQYSLRLNSWRLERLKPVIGDVANNLARSLDSLVTAAARLDLSEEEFAKHQSSIRFPFPDADCSIDAGLTAQSLFLRIEFIDAIMQVWKRYEAHAAGIRAVHLIADGSRRWALEFGDPGAEALHMILPGQPTKEVEIPSGYFGDHEAFEWEGANAMKIYFVVSLRLSEAGSGKRGSFAPFDPIQSFEHSARFVGDMINAFRTAQA